MEHSLLAFSLTLAAGLATGLGCAFCSKKTNTKFLSVSLGFSAGIMIFISLTEILPEAHELLSGSLGFGYGTATAVCALLIGVLLISILDRLFPHAHCDHGIHQSSDGNACSKELLRTGAFAALAFAIHNFPEGLATFLAILENPTTGIALAMSVTLHNIPAGIAICVPIYCASGSRKKAFSYALASGLAGPLGAACGYFFLAPYMNQAFFGFLLASVAGVMIFISLDELLPASRRFGGHHLPIYGLLAGVALIWLCELLV